MIDGNHQRLMQESVLSEFYCLYNFLFCLYYRQEILVIFNKIIFINQAQTIAT